MFWYAVYTKPRQEERGAKNLVAWGIETVYLRLEDRKSYTVPAPFFPQYLFARFDINLMLRKVQFTRGISHIVSFGGVPAAVNDEVIDALRCRADGDMVVRSELVLKPGDAVMIQKGPLQKFMGVFEQELPAERVRILLENVTMTARVAVDKCDVIKLAAAS
jgi:transcriptional antiterminator RfaH